MSQDGSTITLSPVCYNPQEDNGANSWTRKPKLESLPVGTTANNTDWTSVNKTASIGSIGSRGSSQGSHSSSRGSSPRFPLHEITQMNKELGDARQKGEMPKTTASPLDEDALAHDYASLLQLREARGNAEKPPSQEYNHARVDVARRIKERDDRYDSESRDQETQRRVQNYLYSAKKEQFFLQESHSSTPSDSPPESATFPPRATERLVEQLYDVVQQASGYFEATEPFLDCLDHHSDAFSKLVRDMRALNKHSQHVQGQVQENQQQQQHLQQHQQRLQQHQQHLQQSMANQHQVLHHQLSSAHVLTAHLNSLMEPQAKAMQASTESLALLAGIITQLSDQVRIMPTIIQQTVQQTVHNTVQQEVREATRQIMEAQQEAMISLLEPPPQPQPQLAREQARCNSRRRSDFVSKVKGFFRAQPCS